MFLGIFIGKFRGTGPRGPSEYSEERGPSEYSEEHVPRYIPRNMSLGIFRGTCPSVYSEEHVPRYIPRNMSLGIFRGTCPSVYSEEDVPRCSCIFRPLGSLACPTCITRTRTRAGCRVVLMNYVILAATTRPDT
ncbi:hypothetical protein DY000_02009627 [Brassica cretica]|uniref:Uncharacterized protein n=1 Tax=Brassica cretica TaxID=69181 RepID=A0ABQ7C9S3_BRACR|nr:hypothetical protein DY000_02009627 [Brassica cretica]